MAKSEERMVLSEAERKPPSLRVSALNVISSTARLTDLLIFALDGEASDSVHAIHP